MSQRPSGVDPETWRAQRAVFWKRMNRMWTVLMLIAIAFVLARYLGWLPTGG
ncbi:MAG TPA: hypothetical protein VMR31_11095 [Myxococcota bacterium]|nr:hypothetical protein [Myxococcota bacterium]